MNHQTTTDTTAEEKTWPPGRRDVDASNILHRTGPNSAPNPAIRDSRNEDNVGLGDGEASADRQEAAVVRCANNLPRFRWLEPAAHAP